MTSRIFIAIVMIAAASLSCVPDNETRVTGGQDNEKVNSVVVPVNDDRQESPGSFLVRILPEAPSAMTDLQIVHSATGKVTCQWQRNGRDIEGATGVRLEKNLFATGDAISVTVRTEEGVGTASIVIGNSPPKVLSVSFSPGYICAGVDIEAALVGNDQDAGKSRYHYKWSINGSEQPEDSPVLKGNKFRRDDKISLTVTPVNEKGEGATCLTRPIVILNALPRIVSTPPDRYRGGVYSYQVAAEDGDGDALLYTLGAAPAGMTINSRTGLVAWQLNEQSAGSHGVEIVVQDPLGAKATQKYTLAIGTSEGGGK